VVDRPPKHLYEFDEFRIDVEERQLLKYGEPVQLTPKVFDILLALVEKSGHTVTKDTLIKSVWADSFVEEGSLNRNVSTLRKVLGEDGQAPRFVRTVPKRGYRFVGDVHEIVEEDEEFIVERRTKYSLAIGHEAVNAGLGAGRSSLSRLILIALPLTAAFVLIVAWAATSASTSDANSRVASTASGRSTNAEAQELFERGRKLWQDRSAEGLHQATSYLERAVRLDPAFALAHAALGDAYAFDVTLWKKAEATALEAIRLDPSLGEPHATIGFIRTFWEWRLNDADEHFKRAVELSPNYATGHQWYAFNLMFRDQRGSSLAEIKRAIELEPGSAALHADHCQLLYFSVKFDDAIEQCKATLAIDPEFRSAYVHLYSIYTAKEMYPEAVDVFFKAEQLNMTTATPPAQLEELRKAFANGGIRGFWHERVRMLSSGEPPAAYPLAQYYTRLGRYNEAINWLRRAAETHDFEFIFATSDPLHYKLAGVPGIEEIANVLSH
jgi:DNA-binding winged helix-turn-helix (wHTH) protein/tetratricopeptide (TPR) repeat protein